MAPQHAGCTGTVENCVTTVFCAYVTANGQAWVDFDGYMPKRWASDAPRRRAAGIPDELPFATKPQLAMNQLDRQMAAGSPARWVAFDEVYGRSEPLRKKAAEHGLAYVGIIPCDYQIRLPSGAAIRAEQAVRGRGVRAPVLRERLQRTPLQRLGHDRHRRGGAVPADPAAALAPRQLHLLPVLGPTRPPGHHDLLHHHRRAPLAGRDNLPDRQRRVRLGPNPGPYRDGICRHTALAALAQLRAAAIRNTITASITLPADTDTDAPTTARRTPAPRPARRRRRRRRRGQRRRPADPPRRRARPGPRRPTLPTRDSARSSCPSPKPPG